MMFFGIHQPLERAHGWIGLAFAAAIGVHALSRWRSLKGYFTQRTALGILGVLGLAACGLIVASPGHDDHRGGHQGSRQAGAFDSGFESLLPALHLDQAQSDALDPVLEEEASRAAQARSMLSQRNAFIPTEVASR
jgi:hypothetical protein